MKDKITEDIKEVFAQAKNWVNLEVEYAKLTAAEKFTILLSTLVLGLALFLMGLVLLIVLAFTLIDVFKMLFSPWLACLCVAGIIVILMLALFLLRKPILLNPIARFITRLFLNPAKDSSKS